MRYFEKQLSVDCSQSEVIYDFFEDNQLYEEYRADIVSSDLDMDLFTVDPNTSITVHTDKMSFDESRNFNVVIDY